MSRPQPFEVQIDRLFPPVSGLWSPSRGGNPLLNTHRTVTLKQWRIHQRALQLIEGNQTLDGQSTDTSEQVLCVFDIRRDDISAATNYSRIWYLLRNSSDNVEIRSVPMDGNGTETLVVTITSGSAAFAGLPRITHFGHGSVGLTLIACQLYGLLYALQFGAVESASTVGVTAPGTAPTLADSGGGSGPPAATYNGVVTFVNAFGHEGNPSAVGSVTTAGANQINWSAIATGPSGTASRNLYRNPSGGGDKQLVGSIADNTTTTFSDTVVDASLGRVLDDENDEPPSSIAGIASSLSRVALLEASTNTVWFSKIDPVTGLPNWEAYPSSLSLVIPFGGNRSFGTAITYANGDFWVFSGDDIAQLIGDIAVGMQVNKMAWGFGITRKALVNTPHGIAFLDSNMQMRLMDPANLTHESIGDDVAGILDTIERDTLPDGPQLEYDPVRDKLRLIYGTTSEDANDSDLEYDFESRQWSEPGMAYYGMGWAQHHRQMVGFYEADSTLFGEKSSLTDTLQYATIAGAAPDGQLIQIEGYSPSPGDDVDFQTIQFLATGMTPTSGSAQPYLKVSYALDHSSQYHVQLLRMEKKRIAPATGTLGPILSATLSIRKKAKYLSLKIEPASAALRQARFELYAATCRFVVAGQSADERKGLPGGSEQVYR